MLSEYNRQRIEFLLSSSSDPNVLFEVNLLTDLNLYKPPISFFQKAFADIQRESLSNTIYSYLKENNRLEEWGVSDPPSAEQDTFSDSEKKRFAKLIIINKIIKWVDSALHDLHTNEEFKDEDESLNAEYLEDDYFRDYGLKTDYVLLTSAFNPLNERGFSPKNNVVLENMENILKNSLIDCIGNYINVYSKVSDAITEQPTPALSSIRNIERIRFYIERLSEHLGNKKDPSMQGVLAKQQENYKSILLHLPDKCESLKEKWDEFLSDARSPSASFKVLQRDFSEIHSNLNEIISLSEDYKRYELPEFSFDAYEKDIKISMKTFVIDLIQDIMSIPEKHTTRFIYGLSGDRDNDFKIINTLCHEVEKYLENFSLTPQDFQKPDWYKEDDFLSEIRTNLNLYSARVDNNEQEIANLSIRFSRIKLYGVVNTDLLQSVEYRLKIMEEFLNSSGTTDFLPLGKRDKDYKEKLESFGLPADIQTVENARELFEEEIRQYSKTPEPSRHASSMQIPLDPSLGVQ